MRNFSLRHHFLIAAPLLDDPFFTQSVAYILEHNQHGAIGIVINRPLDLDLKDTFSQLSITSKDDAIENDIDLLWGGPVQQEQCFLLHQFNDTSLYAIEENNAYVRLTQSPDMLKAAAQGKGPNNFLIAMGLTCWHSKQLEHEIKHNVWLSCPANSELLFQVPQSQIWHKALKQLQISPDQLVSYAGHA